MKKTCKRKKAIAGATLLGIASLAYNLVKGGMDVANAVNTNKAIKRQSENEMYANNEVAAMQDMNNQLNAINADNSQELETLKTNSIQTLNSKMKCGGSKKMACGGKRRIKKSCGGIKKYL